MPTPRMTTRNTLLRPLAFAALLAVAPLAAAAPATDAQVDKLLQVMQVRQNLEQMLPQIESMQRNMVTQLNAQHPLDADQQARVNRILADSDQRLRQMLAWSNMAPMYRDIYRKTFSADDMQAMTAFYGSPAGQRVVGKMPELMQNTLGAVQKMVVPMLQQTQRDIAREAGLPVPPAPPAPPAAPRPAG